MILRKSRQSIEIVRRGVIGLDDYRNPIYGETRQEVLVYSVSPSTVDNSMSEGQLGSWSSETLTVYAPASLQIASEDRVVWKSNEYEVVGESSYFENIYTLSKLRTFQIKRVMGAS